MEVEENEGEEKEGEENDGEDTEDVEEKEGEENEGAEKEVVAVVVAGLNEEKDVVVEEAGLNVLAGAAAGALGVKELKAGVKVLPLNGVVPLNGLPPPPTPSARLASLMARWMDLVRCCSRTFCWSSMVPTLGPEGSFSTAFWICAVHLFHRERTLFMSSLFAISRVRWRIWGPNAAAMSWVSLSQVTGTLMSRGNCSKIPRFHAIFSGVPPNALA